MGGEEAGLGGKEVCWEVRRRGRDSSKLLLIFPAFVLHSTLPMELSPCRSSASLPYSKAED